MRLVSRGKSGITDCYSLLVLACSRLSVVGDGEKGRAREKNEGGLRRGRKSSLVFSSLVFARPQLTTESLEQAMLV